MIPNWLNRQERNPSPYRFDVVDTGESLQPDETIINYLAQQLVLAHACPEMIRTEYEVLSQDAEDVGLQRLKQYIEDEILPAGHRVQTRIGNFGEVLAASLSHRRWVSKRGTKLSTI